MRVQILFLLIGAALASSNLIATGIECPEQQLADVNRICIRPDFIEGCEDYKDAKTCDKCAKEYELVKGKCSVTDANAINPSVLVGCLKAIDGKCLNCANGFVRKADLCQKGVKECLEYNKDGACELCNEEYSLIIGECRHNLLLGCKLELSDHRCAECFSPFQLESYSCVIKDCRRYNDFGCYACQCGYYITEAKSCRKYEDGCMKYYRSMCTECMPHFKLRGGVCMIDGCLQHQDHKCVTCSDNYDLVKGICEFKNCFDWSEDTCLICKKGFNLVSGKCLETVEKFVCSSSVVLNLR